ncbi:MAG: hypothetical protein ACO2PN_09585 [Pyrobaculum sp.]
MHPASPYASPTQEPAYECDEEHLVTSPLLELRDATRLGQAEVDISKNCQTETWRTACGARPG